MQGTAGPAGKALQEDCSGITFSIAVSPKISQPYFNRSIYPFRCSDAAAQRYAGCWSLVPLILGGVQRKASVIDGAHSQNVVAG